MHVKPEGAGHTRYRPSDIQRTVSLSCLPSLKADKQIVHAIEKQMLMSLVDCRCGKKQEI